MSGTVSGRKGILCAVLLDTDADTDTTAVPSDICECRTNVGLRMPMIRWAHCADHPHIVDLKEVMASKDKIYMVMEFMSGGELFDKIVADGPLEVCQTLQCLSMKTLLLQRHEGQAGSRAAGTCWHPRTYSRSTLVRAMLTLCRMLEIPIEISAGGCGPEGVPAAPGRPGLLPQAQHLPQVQL